MPPLKFDYDVTGQFQLSILQQQNPNLAIHCLSKQMIKSSLLEKLRNQSDTSSFFFSVVNLTKIYRIQIRN